MCFLMNDQEREAGRRIFEKVKKHMGWDDSKTTLWFTTDNPNLGGCAPAHLLALRPKKLEIFIDALINETATPKDLK